MPAAGAQRRWLGEVRRLERSQAADIKKQHHGDVLYFDNIKDQRQGKMSDAGKCRIFALA